MRAHSLALDRSTIQGPKQRWPRSLEELQAQLDRFARSSNEHRPHRALGRLRPAAAYRSKVKAGPALVPVLPTHFRVRHDRVDAHGKLTLRVDSRLHHIGVGRAFAGARGGVAHRRSRRAHPQS